MALVKGPFDLKWGDNVIENVEEVDVEHTVDSEDFVTLQGTTLEIDGNYKATATVTLLGPDISELAAILPQHFIANGDDMSTGETVNYSEGAIDIFPLGCESTEIYNNLDIISCEDPGYVTRLVNVRTRIEDVDFSEKISKVMVKFIGQAARDEATMQIFREGTVATVS